MTATTDVLAVPRLVALVKRDLVLLRRPVLIAAGAVFGVLLITAVAAATSAGSWDFHQVFFPITLFTGGVLVSGSSFPELGDRLRRSQYLLLPASHLEKFLVRWAMTLLGFAVGATVCYWLFSQVAYLLGLLIWGSGFAPLNLAESYVVDFLQGYIGLQALFFLGAVWFRRLVVFKTVLVIFLIGLGLTLVAAVAFRIAFHPYFTGFSLAFQGGLEIPASIISAEWLRRLAQIGSWVLTVWMWLTAYLRLQDIEAR